MLMLSLLVAMWAVVPVCQNTPNRNEQHKFLTPSGRLRAPLVLRDAQQGFAGVSGEIWTIEAGGHISLARFLNEQTDPPYAERNLTPAEMIRLAKAMAASDFLALPDSIGQVPEVNAHVLTLTFGKKKSELALRAGEALTEEMIPPVGDSHATAWRNFVSIALTIQSMAKNRN